MQNIFNAKSRSRNLQLRHELSTFKKGGLTADQYLVAISKKTDEVRDAKITVDDEKLALFALDGLDSSYDAFVAVVTTTSRDISFSEFKELLKAHETRVLWEYLAHSLQQTSPNSRVSLLRILLPQLPRLPRLHPLTPHRLSVKSTIKCSRSSWQIQRPLLLQGS